MFEEDYLLGTHLPQLGAYVGRALVRTRSGRWQVNAPLMRSRVIVGADAIDPFRVAYDAIYFESSLASGILAVTTVFSESADLYDAIYRAFKDYAAEATAIAALVRAAHPSPRTILDVACGTGEHALHLRNSHGFAVDGLDLDRGLLAVARDKMPDARFFEGDMAAFDVGHRYDLVMCLFSSIGYLRSLDRVTAALRCFRRHLAEGGVIVVEPWFAPGVLSDGPGSARHAEAGGVRVERTSHTTVEGRLSTLLFNYRFEDASGVRVASEVHELGLFTQAEMMTSFEEAGLAATYNSSGLTGRGLYVARVAP